MSDQVVSSEFADLELADLESALTRIQLQGSGSVTRKPTITVMRDVAELAPTATNNIAQQLSRGASRPLTHTVRRLLQCLLDVYAHVLDHATPTHRKDAGTALSDGKALLFSVRTYISNNSNKDAVQNNAAKVAAFLTRVHDERWLEDDVSGTAVVTQTQNVLLSPRGSNDSTAAHREQHAFLQRERAKQQQQQQANSNTGSSSSSSSSVVAQDDMSLSSVSAQQEQARLQRALDRKPRDPKRKTWGANALDAAFTQQQQQAINNANSSNNTSSAPSTPAKPTAASVAASATVSVSAEKPRAAPIAARVSYNAATPPPTTVRAVVVNSNSSTPTTTPSKSLTSDAEEARLQRSLNRNSRRGTWSPAKAQAAQANATTATTNSPSRSIHDALAGVSSPSTKVEDVARTVADVAKVVSPRTSYTQPIQQTPPPRVSATRGDADRFNASLDSLTRALGSPSPRSSNSASEQQELQLAERRAQFERDKAAAEAAQAKVAADLQRDEHAYDRAKQHAREMRERAEAEAVAKAAAREQASADERAARLARRDAELAAERERAARRLEERSAAVAEEKERAAAQRAEAERVRAADDAARRAAAAATTTTTTTTRTTVVSKNASPAATATAAAPSSRVAQLQQQNSSSNSRARSGTVEKVLKATVMELTAEDDDNDNDQPARPLVKQESDGAKWDGLNVAMDGLVHEMDDLVTLTTATSAPSSASSSRNGSTVSQRSTSFASAKSSEDGGSTNGSAIASRTSYSNELEAERLALARERARLESERRLLEEERERSRQTINSELERERLALERERQELERLKQEHARGTTTTTFSSGGGSTSGGDSSDAALDVLISDLRTFPISSSAAEREASIRAHKPRVSLNELEREFVSELHALRRAPRSYAALLRSARVPCFIGRQLNLTRSNGMQVALATAEGVDAALEAIEVLERLEPLPHLRVYDGLTFAARDAIARNSTQPDALQRILEFGRAEGRMRQNVWMASLPAITASDIIMAMLISDGDPLRKQRTALLGKEIECIGVCAGHATHFQQDGHYMVVVLCEHFEEN